MRDVLVLISFDTVQFITAIKVRGNHKIVSNIWDPCCVHTDQDFVRLLITVFFYRDGLGNRYEWRAKN